MASAAPPRRRYRYFVLHKPVGCLCSTVDNQPKPSGHTAGERPTVYDVVAAAAGGFPARLGCVGRLDYATSGLLLFTDDARLNQSIRDKASQATPLDKVYTLRVAGKWAAADTPIAKLAEPLADTPSMFSGSGGGGGQSSGTPAGKVRAATEGARVSVLSQRPLAAGEADPCPWPPHGGWVTTLTLTIRDGRNRQIRRLCKRSKLHLRALHRDRIGPLALDGGDGGAAPLKPGACRWLEAGEVAALYRAALGEALDEPTGPARAEADARIARALARKAEANGGGGEISAIEPD